MLSRSGLLNDCSPWLLTAVTIPLISRDLQESQLKIREARPRRPASAAACASARRCGSRR
jgi:hypothetical protein